MKRGEIYFIDLAGGLGSEQTSKRPCVVVQNNVGNKYSPTTIVIPLTTKNNSRTLPVHVEIKKEDFVSPEKAIEKESLALCEQIRTISKTERIVPIEANKTGYIGTLKEEKMKQITKAVQISLGMNA